MRTQEQIQRQIEGLKKMKETLPEFSSFGDPNHKSIDAQIKVLNGKDPEDYADAQAQIYDWSVDAAMWLDGSRDEDLFDE